MRKEMKLSKLILDPDTHTPILILMDREGKVIFPIWIGLLEASAIALEMEKVSLSRPMTHDLMKNIFNMLNVEVTGVEVTDLSEGTFYALIHLNASGKDIAIDARPSDAIAIALRTSSPIYVNDVVIKKLGKVNVENVKSDYKEEESRKWKDLLEQMSPKDFGKYKM